MDRERLDTIFAVTQAMVEELTYYLMGDTLYYQLIVKTPEGTKQPKMTLGALLENLQLLRWAQDELTPGQRQRLDDMEREVDLARRAYSDRWSYHLRRELNGLLSSWRWYLDDARRKRQARENYPSEVHLRTRIDLVMHELAADPETAGQRQELGNLDARLRSMLEGDQYVGPGDQEGRFDRDGNWWLYGQPAAGGQ